ncbi:APC family permease [Streptomyces chartreusis]|uniref:APC family permease n=1 Tax=Streptomyces chartreusis TaxID=1969 RepID=UPI003D8A2F29
MSTSPNAEAPGHDAGRLGRTQLAALSVASFVPASGMALMPYLLAAAAGQQAWTSAVATVAGMIAIGFTIVPFATRFVGTGSLYSYVGEVFGPRARYAVAASLLGGFVVQLGSVAGVIAIYLGSFLRALGLTAAASTPAQIVMYASALGMSVLVSLRGLHTSVRIAVLLALISVPLMVLVTVASGIHTGLDLTAQFRPGEVRLDGTFAGVAIGAAFFVGFESCTSLAAETRDPRRNVPLAVMSVPLLLGLVYLVCTVVQTPGVVALHKGPRPDLSPPAALAVSAGLGTTTATAVDLVLAVAMLAAAIGFTNYGARFVMTLGGDGLLPRSVTRLHRRFRTPWVGLLLVSVLAGAVMTLAALVSSSPTVAYNAVGVLGVAVWIPAYVVIACGAIVLARRARQHVVRSTVAAVVGAAAMVWVYVSEALNPPPHPIDVMVWLAPVLYGVVLILLILNARRSRRPGGASDLRPRPTKPRARSTAL